MMRLLFVDIDARVAGVECHMDLPITCWFSPDWEKVGGDNNYPLIGPIGQIEILLNRTIYARDAGSTVMLGQTAYVVRMLSAGRIWDHLRRRQERMGGRTGMCFLHREHCAQDRGRRTLLSRRDRDSADKTRLDMAAIRRQCLVWSRREPGPVYLCKGMTHVMPPPGAAAVMGNSSLITFVDRFARPIAACTYGTSGWGAAQSVYPVDCDIPQRLDWGSLRPTGKTMRDILFGVAA